MIVHEASLNFQLVRYGEDEPLTTTKRLLAYFTAGVPDDEQETFWILCMNPKRRPLFRQRMKTGPLVAAQVAPRDVIHIALLAEARSIAVMRTDCGSGPLNPTLADGRLLWTIREAAKHLNIEIADYLISRLSGRDYHSWRESDPRLS
jgi:DNA repair protein RadC